MIKKLLALFKAKDKITLYDLYTDIKDIPDKIVMEYIDNGGVGYHKPLKGLIVQ